MYHNKGLVMRALTLTGCLLLSLLYQGAVRADGDDPYPPFVADYDVKINGLRVGKARFSLSHEGADQYLYQQDSVTTGIAAFFDSDTASESSRWRFHNNGIQVIEYQSRREDGDDDDNAHLIFDWENLRVRNKGAGKHWDIEMPEGTLDRMVMQLAMLMELRDGSRVFTYPVAVRGRIKNYRFELVGEDKTELAIGTYRTLKLERKDDDRDKSWTWSAPDLDYFPVRFLKHKKSGIKIELILRDLEFTVKEPQSHTGS